MHWECHEKAFPPLEKLIAELDTKFYGKVQQRRKRPCRPGDGPTAKRLAKRLCEELKRQVDYDFTPEQMFFWVQPPTYRGPRWDLAVWGCIIESEKVPGRKLMLNSWETMSSLVKAKHLSLTWEGGMELGVGASDKQHDEPGPGIKRSYTKT